MARRRNNQNAVIGAFDPTVLQAPLFILIVKAPGRCSLALAGCGAKED
jgi:hypothetical protein